MVTIITTLDQNQEENTIMLLHLVQDVKDFINLNKDQEVLVVQEFLLVH